MMDDEIHAAGIQAFMIEGRELLEQLEQGLLLLEKGCESPDPELINAMFRSAHTIKGSAGIVGIESLQRFTHKIETLLDRVRAGEQTLNGDIITRLLKCCDHIASLLDKAESGDFQSLDTKDKEAELLDGFGGDPRHAVSETRRYVPKSSGGTSGSPSGFTFLAIFDRDSLRYGLDPAAGMSYLASKSEFETSIWLTQRIPDFDELDPEDCWMAFGVRSTHGSLELVNEAFEFFKEDAALVVLDATDNDVAIHERLKPLRERLRLEDVAPWIQAGLVTSHQWLGVAPQITNTEGDRDETENKERIPKETTVNKGGNASSRFVRVPADRLDELVSQVGELVIASAAVDVKAKLVRGQSLQEAVSVLMQLVDTIQSSTMRLRMVPIGETFSRFQRVVRDVSRDLGKSIALEIFGADTELDKAMVERIGDPLMHLVRNAMDHGLESPQERLAQGKPEQGTLRLRAFHDSGSVVVEVSDDGKGLSRDRILNKAIERGLIAGPDGLTDHEIYQLIFEPGFSTAEQVTNLSGRGVGMDVVKKSVEALRGSITLHSTPGMGTMIQMRLPLTLAIIEGFMVGVGQARFILPIDMVVECIELPDGALDDHHPQYLNLRGEVLPYVCLRQAFAMEGSTAKRPSVVVVKTGEWKSGLLVDTLLGEIQTVIKPMSGVFQHLRSICGTSILGTGDIAMILDVNQIVQESIDLAGRSVASLHQGV